MKDLGEQYSALLADAQEVANLRKSLGRVPVFSSLTDDELTAILHVGRMVAYEPREVVFAQDSDSTDLHVVLEGDVYLVRTADKSAPKALAERGPGTSYGEAGFLTRAKRKMSAIVGKKECLQLVIPRDRFEELLGQVPQITSKLYGGIVNGVYERLEKLPAYFRNYVMWGYEPTGELLGKTDDSTYVSKAIVFPLGGAAGGALAVLAAKFLGVYLFSQPVIQAIDENYKEAIPMAAVVMATVGLVTGLAHDALESALVRRRKSSRSCLNCQFIHWKDDAASFNCTYLERGLFHQNIRMGIRPDTYTDCASFFLSPRTGKTEDRSAEKPH